MELLVFFIVLAGLVYLLLSRSKNREAEEMKLLDNYKSALASGNRARAVLAGREYYYFIRKGPITNNDENTIASDLASM